MMTIKTFLSLVKAAAVDWWNDNTFRLAASLAFYTIFSITPVIIIAIGLAGIVFGRERATREVVGQIEALVGPQGGTAIQQLSTAVPNGQSSSMALIIGGITIIIGSTAVFAELQSALNHIWDVQVRPDRGVLKQLLVDRLQSFALVLAVGFLLLVSLLFSAAINAVAHYQTQLAPSFPFVWSLLDVVVSFVVVAVLFAMIYKYLPDVRITWRDVGIGSVVTALLFTGGKYAIGAYLGRLAVASMYGAAGSFLVFLLWVYYSALICFFGAEFTQVYARRYGSRIEPESHAMRKGEKPEEA